MTEQPSIFNDAVIRELSFALYKRKETVAVAESVTAGFLQAALSSGENATAFFQGGLTAYNLHQKHTHLHVDIVQALSCNCVSEQTAVEMAQGVSRLFGTHWGLGVTGYAAPIPGRKMDKLFAFFAITYNHEPVYADKLILAIKEPLTVQLDYCNVILQFFLDEVNRML